ncbi:hypothetical protein MKZ38_008840 [Zalerion maritima]|uniref:Uncharacterized protein n=1 Tax=Zalerion maritima TaxID=339359 RepID=A0AAD5RU17_9PEZI|nr:hypothetical protein MKZ38_008840 [Zalerion maritima]
MALRPSHSIGQLPRPEKLELYNVALLLKTTPGTEKILEDEKYDPNTGRCHPRPPPPPPPSLHARPSSIPSHSHSRRCFFFFFFFFVAATSPPPRAYAMPPHQEPKDGKKNKECNASHDGPHRRNIGVPFLYVHAASGAYRRLQVGVGEAVHGADNYTANVIQYFKVRPDRPHTQAGW